MKQAFLDPLARAGYEARRQALVTGAYPKSAARIPDSGHFYAWDEIPERQACAVQSLYRQEAEAILRKFFGFIMLEGCAEAQSALINTLYDLKEKMFTEMEQAKMEHKG